MSILDKLTAISLCNVTDITYFIPSFSLIFLFLCVSHLLLRNWTSIIRYSRAERWVLRAQGEIETLFRQLTAAVLFAILCSNTTPFTIHLNLVYWNHYDVHCTSEHRYIKSLVSTLFELLTISTFERVSFVDFMFEKKKLKKNSHNKSLSLHLTEWAWSLKPLHSNENDVVHNLLENSFKTHTKKRQRKNISFDSSPIRLVVRSDCRIECSLFDNLITLKWTVNSEHSVFVCVCICMAMCIQKALDNKSIH